MHKDQTKIRNEESVDLGPYEVNEGGMEIPPERIPQEIEELPITTNKSENRLTSQQHQAYKQHREECLAWLLIEGQHPIGAEGYSYHTVYRFAYRHDKFYRWVWEQEGKYTIDITHDHAHNWIEKIAYSDTSNSHKDNTVKALKALYRWRSHRYGEEEWEPRRNFQSSALYPRDYLTLEERDLLKEAALEYGTIPAYNDLTPAKRDMWKEHVAQALDKPKHEVSPSDWEDVTGWKIPSLIATSLDAGLRPIEVQRSKLSWLDPDNNALRITEEDSSKNSDNWVVALTEETSEYLKKWLDERENHWRYRSSDSIWLTKHGNPYKVQSLRYLLEQLCEIAGIDTEDRQVTWYSIRHSTGTYLTREEGLKATAAQLRHKSIKTTMKYDQAPLEFRRDALERMQ